MSETLKAVVLAAGNPILLESMGDRSVVQCVVESAREIVPPEDIWVVIGNHSDRVRAQLGGQYHYVVQESPIGICDAVRRAAAALGDFHGDLLVLYGDKPMLRSTSLRGLLNRHSLRNADATLLAVNGNEPDANIGAYVVRADAVEDLFNQRAQRLESYRIYDPDEVQGINDSGDLALADIIVRKRLYRPHRDEEQNLIHFGTGGWRAVIGEGFTMHNVRRLCQALANEITRRGEESHGVVVGYDRRFLSRQAGEAAAEVFAGNNIATLLLPEPAPTPLVTYATARRGSAYGLAFTASHNPPEWNGLKVFRGDGSLLLDHETRQIEAETNALPPQRVIKLDLDLALAAGVVEQPDFTNEYVDAVEALIDLEAIRNAGLKLIVDPMYGVGQLTLGTVLTEARCRVTFIHERHNPLFGGRSPAPDAEALRLLSSTMRDDGYDLGLAMDGDADRIAIVDERGEYVSVNDLLLLLYWYLHEVRGDHGGVVRNLATTHLLDRLAKRLGEECYEVPVGFKHVVSAMLAHNAVLGGESSGGLTIRGHILGKDGIFACALVVEMMAKTGQRVSELLERVYALTGRLYQAEESMPATPEMRVAIPRRLCDAPRDRIASYRVLRTSQEDGIKLYLENDNWALLRFSGTEPVLRLAVEADSPEKAGELLAWLRQFVKA